LLALATFLESIEETRTAIRRLASVFPLVEQAAAARRLSAGSHAGAGEDRRDR
jgi:hypothetical protein